MKKERPIKIRKSWNRNPAEQVVPNLKSEEEIDIRKLTDEALTEYEEESKKPNSEETSS